MSGYGLPPGTNIQYGEKGFPQWVYDLGAAFQLQASTYPGHQESERAEKGFAPNPQRLNRGIDWTGSVESMQKFAEYLRSIRSQLEQVIWENPRTGERIGVAGGDDVSKTAYYATDYVDHRSHVHCRQSQPIPLPGKQPVKENTVDRPDFNEYWIESPNGGSRNGTKVDLFLLHTEEGGPVKNGADRLARWLSDPSRQVSYHYAISEDPQDHGVTVVDIRDTDTMSWSCLSANARSVNLVFAGSKASWTRSEWLLWAPRAIDVAAYLAAQDCAKYNIPKRVIKPPYGPPGGVSDHRYVTTYLKDGTHTDVGGPLSPPWTGFPWDVFEAAFLRYAGVTPQQPPAPTPPPPAPPMTPSKVYPKDYTDRELMESIWRKLDGLTAAYEASKK